MLANFFNSKDIPESYDVTFVYRYTLEYENGLTKRVSASFEKIPVHIYDHFDLYNLADSIRWKIFHKPVKGIINLLLIKYVYLFVNILNLRKIIRRTKIDILHINNGGYPGAYSAIAMVLAAKLCGIRRIVFVVNNIALGYHSPERWLDYFFDRITIRGVAVFVTGSMYAGHQLHENLGVPQSKITCIHNGIGGRVITETREQVIKRLGIPENRLVFSVIAILEERKGQMYLLRALKQFKDTHGTSAMPFCIIEGTGADEKALKCYVTEQGLENNVLFIPHEMQIFNLINASDFIVLPSIKNEDFPNIILESMSLSKPVIASDFSGIPEQIEHMNSGILVKPKDVSGLMDAIKIIVDSKDLRITLGKNAKMRFDNEFTEKIAIEHYSELYKHLIEEMPL
ncbi:MAG: glycosyltransferase family 4 protein [Methanoregula sp.]|nr:glycosyltransferase family 4 protein [Methanoregula sp.]